MKDCNCRRQNWWLWKCFST